MQREHRYHQEDYALRCHDCGQRGALSVTTNLANGAWSFVSVGFIGLAVNRYHASHSVMRCNRCWSSDVRFHEDADPKAADPGRG